jgi:Zn-dependent protease with chaperone function
MIAASWALWDLRRTSTPVANLTPLPWWTNAIPNNPLVFWGSLLAGIFVIYLSCYFIEKAFIGRRWAISDILRLAFWRTVCPSAALLCVVMGFDALYGRHFGGLWWLVVAAVAATVGVWRLRLAQGMKFQPVQSGELYKRANALAKKTQTPLKQVYVVPAGKGQLTNAYSLSRSIAVTDNYGKFLRAAQLDFIIGHELGHVRAKHGRKRILTVVAIYAGLGMLCFFWLPSLLTFRPCLDVLIVLVPIIALDFQSRRFEYVADQAGVELVDPETAIQALINLYRFTRVPADFSRVTELFMTHPSLRRRLAALGARDRISPEELTVASR